MMNEGALGSGIWLAAWSHMVIIAGALLLVALMIALEMQKQKLYKRLRDLKN